jgi:hypothetical protein
MMLPSSDTSPWVWAIEHLSALGWPVIVYCAWKIATYFERVSKQASKTIDQINTLAINHAPHMEASLANQDGLLHSMDQSLKTIAANSGRRREDF